MNRRELLNQVAAAALVGLTALVEMGHAAAALDPFAAHPGLEISLELDKGSSPPSGDPGSTQLTHAMEAAASHWEAIFADLPSPGVNVSIKYSWKSGTEGSAVVGTRDQFVPAKTTAGTLGSTTYSIKFYTRWLTSVGVADIPWYIDTDLTDPASEFDLEQVLFRDSGWSLGRYLPSGLPELAEVGYRGNASAGGGAEGRVDLYTYALRQIGQTLLQCGSEPTGLSAFITVSTYSLHSFTSNFVSGASDGTCEDDHVYVDTLMRDMRHSLANVPFGERYLPSTFDILLIAASNGWTAVRLPRREMLLPLSHSIGETEWVDEDVWLGGVVPDSDSDAYVRDPSIYEVILGGAANARDLYVGWDPNPLTTDRHAFIMDGDSLGLSGDLTVESDETLFVADGALAVGGDAFVASDAILQIAGSASIEDTLSVLEGMVAMAGGDAAAELIDVEQLGEISGNGSLQGVLINDGLIDPDQVGPLRFHGTLLDLDGEETAEDGRIEAIFNDVHFTGPIADPFGGEMVIEKRVQLSEELDIDGEGEIKFAGDFPSLVASNTVVSHGTLRSEATEAHLASPVTFRSGSVVEASGVSHLHLDGETTFEGGEFKGTGTVDQVGNVTVTANATVLIRVQTYNWDGDDCGGVAPIGHTTEIEPGARFRITQSISSCADDGYDGVVTISGVPGNVGILDVFAAWQLDGGMTLDGGIVTGGDLTNNGYVSGRGTIGSTFYSGTGCVSDPESDITFVDPVPPFDEC